MRFFEKFKRKNQKENNNPPRRIIYIGKVVDSPQYGGYAIVDRNTNDKMGFWTLGPNFDFLKGYLVAVCATHTNDKIEIYNGIPTNLSDAREIFGRGYIEKLSEKELELLTQKAFVDFCREPRIRNTLLS